MPLTFSQTASETSRFEPVAAVRVLMNLTKVYFHRATSAPRSNFTIYGPREDRDCLRAFLWNKTVTFNRNGIIEIAKT